MSTLTTPNSMLQRRGGSSGGKMSSMSWLFVILGVQMVVFLGFVVVFFGFEQRRQGELEEMQGELHRLRRENMRNSNKLMRANTRMLKYEADIKKEPWIKAYEDSNVELPRLCNQIPGPPSVSGPSKLAFAQ